MTSAKEMELLLLVKKGLEADKILNNTKGHDCTFDEFMIIKNDSDLGKIAKDKIVSMHDDDIKRIVNYLMSGKNNGKKVKIFSCRISDRFDYYQAGRMALSKAIDTFDLSKKTPLLNYAFLKIVYAVVLEATKDENISDNDKKLMNDVRRIKNNYASKNLFFDEYIIAEELGKDVEEIKRIEKIIELNKKSKLNDNITESENDVLEEEKKMNEEKVAVLFEYLYPEEVELIESEFKFSNSYTKNELCHKYNLNEKSLEDKIRSAIEKMRLGILFSNLYAKRKIKHSEFELLKTYYNFYNSMSCDEVLKKYGLDSISYKVTIDSLMNKISMEVA